MAPQDANTTNTRPLITSLQAKKSRHEKLARAKSHLTPRTDAALLLLKLRLLSAESNRLVATSGIDRVRKERGIASALCLSLSVGQESNTLHFALCFHFRKGSRLAHHHCHLLLVITATAVSAASSTRPFTPSKTHTVVSVAAAFNVAHSQSASCLLARVTRTDKRDLRRSDCFLTAPHHHER